MSDANGPIRHDTDPIDPDAAPSGGAHAVGVQDDDGAGAGDRTTGERSTRPVDDASTTGRGADARASADAGRDDDGLPPTEPHDQQAERTGGDHDRSATPDSLAALVGDDSIGHVFDQTNGVIEGASGESDGTAAGDEQSAGERAGFDPVGQQDAYRADHYGEDDGRDRNP